MKKAEKEIQIRTAAKVKLWNLKAEMMTAKSDAAKLHADIMFGMSDKCENERFNEIKRYGAEKMAIEADFYQKKAALYAETETACQEATDDDDEPETEHEQEQPMTVYCDGTEHAARISARRLINKLPHIPEGGAISVMISRGSESLKNSWWIYFTCFDGSTTVDGCTSERFDEHCHNAESEAAYVDRVRASFDARKEEDNE